LLALGAIVLVFALAAATAVVLFRPREPSWKLLSVSGAPAVQLDGAPVGIDRVATLRPGSHLRVGNQGTITVGIEGAIPIRIETGGEATLGSSKGGLGGSLPSVTLHAGTLRADSTAATRGVWVETYGSSVLFQGTPFSIAVRGETLDVVVDSVGADVIVKKTGEMAHVPPGYRYVLVGDSTSVMAPVAAFADSAAPGDSMSVDSLRAAPAAEDTASP
jgi:hypothetical protein